MTSCFAPAEANARPAVQAVALGLPCTSPPISSASCWTQKEFDMPRDYHGLDPPFFDDAG